ncbi:MAG TPA: response regulator [Bryobacteraceae bacterium]|nr:response regulator [Bryobacteraceae bacterium]
MLSTLKELPSAHAYPVNIPILLVSPHQNDVAALRHILHHSDWDITPVETVIAARKHLSRHAAAVVLCERDLPDGSWSDILRTTSQMEQSPLLLVISRHADDALWAEVLNLGGYDVLLKPFDKGEVARVVGMAWRHWWSICTGSAARRAAAHMHQQV